MKKSNRALLFGRRKRLLAEEEKLQQQEEMPDPRMSAREWAEWLLLTSQVEHAEAESR
jgi:hypothetical protein